MNAVENKLLELLEHQQVITAQCLDIIKLAYSQDTASDEGRTTQHPSPSVHAGVKMVESVTQLQEQYR